MSAEQANHKRIGMEVSFAVAEAVKMLEVEAIAAYPITPQTHIVEELSQMVADGDLDAEYIPVESEHSAMSACLGTSLAGARTYTATSSQGLALMNEVLFVASGLRLPIVMTIVNRSLSAPLSIWGDHSDIMSIRDVGWLQFFAENGQEAFDLTICAFKVAEDKRVLLPTGVNLDGFSVSHVVEPMLIPDPKLVRDFVPSYEPQLRADPADPVMIGPIGIPEIYTEAHMARDVALIQSRKLIDEVFADFEKVFGRRYHALESYRADDAEVIVMAMGGMAETAMGAVDTLRNEGIKAGLVHIRVWRPFPFDDLRAMLKNAELVLVIDRALCAGGPGGPVASEVRSALYPLEKRPQVACQIAGLSGRDVRALHIVQMLKRSMAQAEAGELPEYELHNVREVAQ
ncbi:MAG: transketolase C-terminal domain-containing protein [Candidatus Alcyoniella australis]|nr:transketolase C-terminal domain-containing protein [Candidatus Alcyoniella australis]